ncbi:MAG: hypothetical protein U9R54_06480 [Bacteroidota bacterium]|nr:hypothetical protein [Bacteroidota bacterium]
MHKHVNLLILIVFLFSISVKGQDNSIENCSNLLNSGYVSDGQEYIAKLDQNNRAKFHATFFGGSLYRIVACTDIKNYNLQLSIYDTEKNLLFSNTKYDYSNYWNFSFKSTISCIIELEIDADKQIKEKVMLLIGFKEK